MPRSPKKPPNEKTIELLFSRYLLARFPKGILLAPTTREEFADAYDAQLTCLDPCFEVVFQFKASQVSGEQFRIRCSDHQHARLRLYPAKTAFYVAPLFKSVTELEQAQLAAQQPEDFLKHYLAADASRLPRETSRIHFGRNFNGNPCNPTCEVKGQEEREAVSTGDWFRGDEIIHRIRSREVGAATWLSTTREKLEADHSPATSGWNHVSALRESLTGDGVSGFVAPMLLRFPLWGE